MGPPTAYILKAAVLFSLECTTGGSHSDWVTGGRGFVNCLLSSCSLSPGMKITVPRSSRGWVQSMAEAAGQPFSSGLLIGEAQSQTTRKQTC